MTKEKRGGRGIEYAGSGVSAGRREPGRRVMGEVVGRRRIRF